MGQDSYSANDFHHVIVMYRISRGELGPVNYSWNRDCKILNGTVVTINLASFITVGVKTLWLL